MIKKTITYEDFNGKEHTEDFYFNLSKAELTRMEMRETMILNDQAIGGLNNRIQAVVDAGNGGQIMEIFEDLIKQAYGVRSADGKQFIKNQESLDKFIYSNAYDVLFMELVTDAKAAAEFVNGIVPKDLQQGEIGKKKPQDFQGKKSGSKFTVVQGTDESETVDEKDSVKPLNLEPEVAVEESEDLENPHTLTEEERKVLAQMRSEKQD